MHLKNDMILICLYRVFYSAIIPLIVDRMLRYRCSPDRTVFKSCLQRNDGRMSNSFKSARRPLIDESVVLL